MQTKLNMNILSSYVGKEIMLISNYKNYIIIILHQDYKNKDMIKVGVNDAASYLLDA